MDNQHKLIKGYRDLTADEIAAMNYVKSRGEDLGQMLKDLRDLKGTDTRWIDIAETHLQQGIMAAVRSIAKPESF